MAGISLSTKYETFKFQELRVELRNRIYRDAVVSDEALCINKDHRYQKLLEISERASRGSRWYSVEVVVRENDQGVFLSWYRRCDERTKPLSSASI